MHTTSFLDKTMGLQKETEKFLTKGTGVIETERCDCKLFLRMWQKFQSTQIQDANDASNGESLWIRNTLAMSLVDVESQQKVFLMSWIK